MDNRDTRYELRVRGKPERFPGMRYGSLPALLLILVLLVVPVSADEWVGGLPLTTVQTGTVSGGLYVDANTPNWGSLDVTKTFAPIPSVSSIQWARLYVSVYNGHMKNAYQGTALVTFDGNDDGTFETVLGTEDLNVAYSYPGEGGSGPVTVNAHGNRVTSDYLMWYDVKNYITSTSPQARVATTKVNPSFDGRIKAITLVVAYNDGDSDQIYYWVNQGHDVDSYLSDDNIGDYIGTTTFDLSGFTGTVTSATLTVNHLASTDGTYTFRGNSIPTDPAEGNYQAAYFGSNIWDVTSMVQAGTGNLLSYDRGSATFYKIPLAFLTIKKQGTPSVQPPLAGFSATPLSGTAPLAVSFTDSSTNTPTTWKWEYKTGAGSWTQFSTVRNPSYTFPTGTYDIRLTATNAAGSDGEIKAGYITVNAASLPPLAAFSAAPTSGTAPLTVTFSDQSTNSPTSWKWEYKNATIVWTQFATTRNPSFSFSSSGIYDIRLTATNAAGSDNETKAGYITVNNPPSAPVAAFGATPTSGPAPLAVTFSDLSTGTVTSRAWDFNNDGSTDSTAQNPSHSYSTPGSFTVNLTVSGPGGSDSERKTGYITVTPPPPVAAFTAIPRSGSPPLAVTFTDQSTNTPTSWKWEYKNATVDWTSFATTKNPSNTFVTGTYDIRLNATNNGGSDVETKTGYITVNTTPVPPNADFSADRTGGSVPLTVRFSDTSTGMITGWTWDFNGDGSMDSTDQDPVYTYTAPGSYTVNMTVSGPGGTDSALKTGYIVVTPSPPVAAFTATPKSGSPPLTVKFTDISTGTVSSWAWDFTNDGTIDSTTKNSTYTYTSAGIYTVNLSVTGQGGSSSTTDTIVVSQTALFPDANFTADLTRGSAPLTVKFRDKSEGTITSWAWDFNNDGRNESAEQNPSYTFPETGAHTVTLTVTGPAGSDTEKKIDYINARDIPDCDLTIGGAINPLASTVFAKEPNTIRIFNVKNNGPATSSATTIELKASDGFTGRGAIPSLASGENTTIMIIDTTVRSSAGQTIRYNVTVDPDDAVGETDETNNVKLSTDKVVTYNGYKGKRYWTGGDITTRKTFELKGGLVYSFGDSVYRSGSFGGSGWTTNTMTWSSDDLPVPANATVKQVVLYAPYTWDNTNEIESISLTFNGDAKTRGNWYNDKSNFGSYAEYVYGLVTYDVTSSYKKNAQNTATFSRGSSDAKLSMYGCTLAVVYEDTGSYRKQIFINEGFDLLGADESGYATTPEEATAYVPFSGLTIDPAAVSSADLITFVASGDSEGNLLFNDVSVGSGIWDYGSSSGPQVAVATRDVKNSLTRTSNTASIQSTPMEMPAMGALQQFLVVEYGSVTSANRTSTALVANFSAEPLTGEAPLKVNFTDLSTGNPFSWSWDFENDGVIDNTTQNPQYTFRNSGNYSVLLTVKNATATESVTRTGYIIVKNATVATNVTAQPVEADPTSTVSYLKAPPEETVSHDPTASGISADVTSSQEKSGDLIGGIISVLQRVAQQITGGLHTAIKQLPFFSGVGAGT